MIVRCREYHK